VIVALCLTNDKVETGIVYILESHPSRTAREEWGTLYMGVRYKKNGKGRATRPFNRRRQSKVFIFALDHLSL